jgi:hypothetical protein
MTEQRPVGSRIRRGSVSDVYPEGALSDDLFACEIRLFVNSPSAILASSKSPRSAPIRGVGASSRSLNPHRLAFSQKCASQARQGATNWGVFRCRAGD